MVAVVLVNLPLSHVCRERMCSRYQKRAVGTLETRGMMI
jgi:hypothetical protein